MKYQKSSKEKNIDCRKFVYFLSWSADEPMDLQYGLFLMTFLKRLWPKPVLTCPRALWGANMLVQFLEGPVLTKQQAEAGLECSGSHLMEEPKTPPVQIFVTPLALALSVSLSLSLSVSVSLSLSLCVCVSLSLSLSRALSLSLSLSLSRSLVQAVRLGARALISV